VKVAVQVLIQAGEMVGIVGTAGVIGVVGVVDEAVELAAGAGAVALAEGLAAGSFPGAPACARDVR